MIRPVTRSAKIPKLGAVKTAAVMPSRVRKLVTVGRLFRCAGCGPKGDHRVESGAGLFVQFGLGGGVARHGGAGGLDLVGFQHQAASRQFIGWLVSTGSWGRSAKSAKVHHNEQPTYADGSEHECILSLTEANDKKQAEWFLENRPTCFLMAPSDDKLP